LCRLDGSGLKSTRGIMGVLGIGFVKGDLGCETCGPGDVGGGDTCGPGDGGGGETGFCESSVATTAAEMTALSAMAIPLQASRSTSQVTRLVWVRQTILE